MDVVITKYAECWEDVKNRVTVLMPLKWSFSFSFILLSKLYLLTLCLDRKLRSENVQAQLSVRTLHWNNRIPIQMKWILQNISKGLQSFVAGTNIGSFPKPRETLELTCGRSIMQMDNCKEKPFSELFSFRLKRKMNHLYALWKLIYIEYTVALYIGY